MEITIDNYFEKESEIKADIKNCDFLSFDLEMTGISVGSRHLLDSPNERYLKHKSSAEKYKIIQFGLVPWFKKEDPNNKNKIIYEAKPYNIYCFPGKEMEHTCLNCEVSALIFNSKHGMNFNTWIYKGVNYLNNKNYTNLLLRKKIIPVFHCVNITKNDKNEKTEKSIEKNDIRDSNINSNNNFDNNSSYTKITIANNMSNISKKNSPIYSHQNNKVSIISHNSKNKSNLHNHPISLVLHNPLNSHEKNKAKKELPRNIMINSFTNLDIELNNSPVNRTNCDSSSPNGSDGLSSFIILNNSGINLTKNSSSGNVFKKPCIDKKNIKTFFTNNKKKLTSNNLESNIDISQENIFYENSPENLKSEQLSNNFFSNTVYLSQMNEYSKSKDKNRTIKVD
jgi:hypothetical protein